MRRTGMSSLIYVMMWASLWSWAYGQNVTRTTPAPSSSAAVSASPTANSTLKFDPIPTLTTCQTVRLSWTYTGPSVAGRNLSILAIGNQGDQTNTTTGDDVAVNEQLFVVDATDTSTDYLVKLRYGRYYLHGRINLSPSYGANSPLFWVQEGDDLSCLTETNSTAGSSASSSGTSANTSAAPSTSASAAGAASGSGSSSIGSGAIAGIVVGVIGGLVVVALVLYFCCYKRRRESTNRHPEISHLGGGHVPQRVSRHFPLHSVGGSADSHEKDEAALYGSDPSTPNYLAQYSPTQSRHNPFATLPNTPLAPPEPAFIPDDYDGAETVTAGSTPPRDARRQSQPPISPTDPTPPRSRSNSQPSDGPSGKVAIKRNVSARRKPVPSLGAELKSQLAQQQQGRDAGNKKEHLRSSFQLMPDPPKPINE